MNTVAVDVLHCINRVANINAKFEKHIKTVISAYVKHETVIQGNYNCGSASLCA